MNILKSLSPLEIIFDKRIGKIYDAMVQRFGERCYKSGKMKGRVFRPAIPIHFTKTEFLIWAEEQLGSKDGEVQCEYCSVMLDARSIAFDHIQPIEQGGSTSLENMCCCCQPCNRYKGAISFAGFEAIKKFLRDEIGKSLTLADARDIERRLRSGGGFYKTSKKAKDAQKQLRMLQS